MPPPSSDSPRAAPADDRAVLCSCHTSSVPTPAGEILLVRVFGVVDRATEHVLRTALAEAGRMRPRYLVVDVAGMGFCSVRGLALLAGTPAEAAGYRIDHVLGGVEPRMERFLRLLWPDDALPVRYPSAAAAVIAAMGEQHGRRGGDRRDRFRDLTDAELVERTRGDSAHRELERRHRTDTYRSALRILESSEDPDEAGHDLTRLRIALAAFGEADPTAGAPGRRRG